ncbi:MAG: BolA family protein [Arenicellales bacterium]|jgi:BolA protein|nr:MAG: BolA family transcriptional regulator [Proteobacteria bacterium TMED51]HAU43032.1 BolA family transcriptional regulator [Gammaproteobacteria bacterium]HBP83882.1 BolA family transcriptional regulator [Gammaproteobacteria bacterium]HCL93167.1 BolA family transcriptional regulator [Gammaproteobacteria bacterium]|tara:strand:- start:408 stop:674 length:267 start_codon:yes stop_codon:yes gene_type:complete
MDTPEVIVSRLREHLSAESVEIEDQSHLHAGHAGAAGGGGHYEVTIVASCFKGLNTLARHRLVYEAVGELMKKEIHALSIQAYSAEEL